MKSKLEIGLDLDHVLYPIIEDFERYFSKVFDETIDLSGDIKWEWWEAYGLTQKEFMQHFADGVNSGHFFNSDPKPGANELIHYLIDQGHSVHIVTHREVPNALNKCRELTFSWIGKQKWPVNSVTISGDKSSVYSDIFLDDGQHNLDRLKEVSEAYTGFSSAIAYDAPWNTTWEGPRVHSLTEFKKLVDAISTTNLGRL